VRSQRDTRRARPWQYAQYKRSVFRLFIHCWLKSRDDDCMSRDKEKAACLFPTLILTRKSPDLNRILKKGKITHTPDVTQLPSTLTLNHNALGLTTPTQSDTKKSAAMQALMEEFTSQLESLSKTLSSLLNLNQDLAPIDTTWAQKALHSLSETLKAKATPQTLTKTTHTSKSKNTRTYAAVAAATPTQLPLPHLARHNKQLTRPRRLLIAPHSDSVKVPHKPPHEMRDSFNCMLRN